MAFCFWSLLPAYCLLPSATCLLPSAYCLLSKTMGFATIAIHTGQEPDAATGAVSVPIYQTSTYAQDGLGKNKGYEYARTQNPTRSALERNLAALEGAKFGFAFASGMAAIDATLRLVKAGEHVIVSDNTYGGTARLFTSVLANYNIEFTFVDTSDVLNVEAAVQPNTKMVFIETPTNPVMIVTDLKAVSEVAHRTGARVVCDNTFMSPYLQRPLEFGVDIVVHSTTKYLNGHSDGIGGMVVLESVKLCTIAESLGGVETLICHPATMTHGSVDPEKRERLGITDGLVRISVGIEDTDDIITDLDQALQRI